jgi:hypothetical protein
MATNNATNTSNPITVAQGGTGDASLTAYAVLCGGTTSTGNVQSIAGVGSSGQVLTSNGASALPTFQSLSAMTWSEVTGTSQSAAVNNGYIANNASLVTITLPSTAALGSIVHVVGKGAGLWKLAANTGQTIKFGDQTTTTAGNLTATNQFDAIQVICITADTTWACTGVAQGNITVA